MSSSDRFGTGNTITAELGGGAIFIDGECNFWVQSENYGTTEYLHGSLTPEQAAEMGEDFHYSRWEHLAGQYFDDEVFDAGTLIAHNGVDVISCYGCSGSNAPSQVLDILSNQEKWRNKMTTQGLPIDGPIRIIPVPFFEDIGGLPEKSWPLVEDPDVIWESLSGGEAVWNSDYGDGYVVENAEELKSLREARTFWIEYQDSMEIGSSAFTKTADGRKHWIFMRDVLPFENLGDGTLPLP